MICTPSVVLFAELGLDEFPWLRLLLVPLVGHELELLCFLELSIGLIVWGILACLRVVWVCALLCRPEGEFDP